MFFLSDSSQHALDLLGVPYFLACKPAGRQCRHTVLLGPARDHTLYTMLNTLRFRCAERPTLGRIQWPEPRQTHPDDSVEVKISSFDVVDGSVRIYVQFMFGERGGRLSE
jgi:hypothetical protein